MIANGTKVKIHNNPIIDDLECTVVGVAYYYGEGCHGNIYVVRPVDNSLIEGYETFTITDACFTILN